MRYTYFTNLRILKELFMLAKIVIVVFLFLILYALGSGLYFLVREKDDSDRMVKALTWRIGLSLLLFILLFIAFFLGWITPHPL